MLARFKLPLCLIVLIGCALAAHHRSLSYPFVEYDDQLFVFESARAMGGITLEGVRSAFTDVGGDANWVPMARLSHMLDVQLHGLNAQGHHLTNILLHTANVVLLALLLMQLTGCFWRPFAVALLLAVYPVHVESVAWISERRDVLSLFFGLLCMMAYAGYSHGFSVKEGKVTGKGRRWGLYLLMCLLGMMAMMAKPSMVTLPCVLLLLDFWPLKRVEAIGSSPARMRGLSYLVLEKLPLFAMAGLSAVLTAQAQVSAMADGQGLPFTQRLVRVPLAYVDYLEMLFWPVHLSPLYADHLTWSVAQAAASIAVILLMTYVALRQWRSRGYLLAGWLWFLGAMVPMIGLIQVGQQTHACRYAYFPFIGLYVMLIWLAGQALVDLGPRSWKLWLTGTGGVVLTLACIAGSYQQTQIWSGNEALYAAANRENENPRFLALTRSRQLILQQQEPQARAILQQAIVHSSLLDSQLIHALAVLEISLNHLDQAHKQSMMLVHYKADTSDTWLLLAEIATLRKQPELALELSLKAAAKNPRSAMAHMYVGTAYKALKQEDDAMKELQIALSLDPLNDRIQYEAGTLLASRGQYAKAISLLHAVTQNPRTNLAGPAWYALADALLSQGELKQALQAFTNSLNMPGVNQSWVWNSMGIIQIKQRNIAQARDCFIQALKADPSNPQAAENLKKTEQFLRSQENR